MKKMCLLAAAASVFAINAQAADWSNKYFRPYIGADYVYSHAKHGGMANAASKDYNSWMVNIGTDIAEYTSIEAFFQQAPERKAHHADGDIKSDFYAYGLDLYGRMPIMCSGFNALASLGVANYNTKYKFDGTSEDKTKSADYAIEQEIFTGEEFSNRSQEQTDDAMGRSFNLTEKRDDLKDAYSDETAKPRLENTFESVSAKDFTSSDKTETNAEKTKTVDAENIGEKLNAGIITKRTSAAFIRRNTALKHIITPDALKKKFFQEDYVNEVSKSQTDSAQEKENNVIESAESNLKENEKKGNPAFLPRTSHTERTHKESALRLKKMFETRE